MPNTHVLITGANRGIGKGILERYLARPNHTVIAAIGDPSHPTSTALQELPKGEGSRLLVVKVDPLVYDDAAAAATELQTDHSIDHLDIVVANAGLANAPSTVTDIDNFDLRAHLDVNLYGFVALYQAVRDLLKQAPGEPIWVTVGNAAADPTDPEHAPSKSLAHWITVKADGEESWLSAFAIHPGFVASEMGMNGHSSLESDNEVDMDDHSITVDVSCDGIMKVLDESSKEETGGNFLNWLGEVGEW